MAFDPTGTAGIRKRFRLEAQSRLRRLTAAVQGMLVEGDVLGLLGAADYFTQVDRGVKLDAFSQWLYQTTYHVLASDGYWTIPYVTQAYMSGLEAGNKIVGGAAQPEMDGLYQALAKAELEGISDALIQRVTRCASMALVQELKPGAAWRAVRREMAQVAVRRLNLMCSTLVVQAHNEGRIDAFRAAGVKRVGINPEGMDGPMRQRDHAHRRTRDAIEEMRGLYNVETAGDKFVCEECEDLADEGPYSLPAAIGLLPAHPDCRCALIPAWDERFGQNREMAEEE